MVDSFRESRSMALKVQREELHLFIESLRRKSRYRQHRGDCA
jgi:hypothetical protein